MPMRPIWTTLLALSVSLCASSVWAQGRQRSFVTQHATQVSGHKIRYDVRVEEFVVNNKAGAPAASLFATTYIRTDLNKATELSRCIPLQRWPQRCSDRRAYAIRPRETGY